MSTPQEQLLFFAEKIKNEINGMIPAKVMKVNSDGTVNVLAIRNDEIEDCVITVPVIRLETQRAFIQLKIAPGDRGVIKFCDKSIEDYRQGNELYNGDERTHSISDGIFQLGFLPDNEKFIFPEGEITIGLKNKKFVTVIDNEGNSKTDASTISIKAGQSKFILSVDEKGNLTINAPAVTIKSELTTVNGDMQVNGTVTASTDVIGGGISLKNHTHKYNPGTGSPTPSQPPE